MTVVLSDVILPEEVVQAGVRGKNMRKNGRTQNQGGFVRTNVIWRETLRQYELGYVPMTLTSWRALEGLHEVTDGGAYGFLMKDPKDQTVSLSEGVLRASATDAVAGEGYGVPSYTLAKTYTSIGSTRTVSRRVTRPETVSVYLNGVLRPVGVGANEVQSIDYDTGQVVFNPAGSATIVGVTPGFQTVLTFDSGDGAFIAGIPFSSYVYITGASGPFGAIANNQRWEVINKAANTLVLDLDTNGVAAPGPNGSIHVYPQDTDTLSWSGAFYVPVQFTEDDLDWDLVLSGPYEGRLVAGPSVTLQEVRE
jgi:uncharacterized protein (TIGR02217 family)